MYSLNIQLQRCKAIFSSFNIAKLKAKKKRKKLFNWPKSDEDFSCHSETDFPSSFMWSVKTIKSFPFIRMREWEGRKGQKEKLLRIQRIEIQLVKNFLSLSHCRWLKAHFGSYCCLDESWGWVIRRNWWGKCENFPQTWR